MTKKIPAIIFLGLLISIISSCYNKTPEVIGGLKLGVNIEENNKIILESKNFNDDNYIFANGIEGHCEFGIQDSILTEIEVTFNTGQSFGKDFYSLTVPERWDAVFKFLYNRLKEKYGKEDKYVEPYFDQDGNKVYNYWWEYHYYKVHLYYVPALKLAQIEYALEFYYQQEIRKPKPVKTDKI